MYAGTKVNTRLSDQNILEIRETGYLPIDKDKRLSTLIMNQLVDKKLVVTGISANDPE